MKEVVKVTANEQGSIFTKSVDANGVPKLDKNKEQYGYIRVEQSEIDLNFSYGSGGVKRRSALIPMSAKAWENVKGYYSVGMEIKGKILNLESLEQKPGFKPKTAGKDGEVLTSGGKTIFHGTEYTSDLTRQDDPTIAHENVIVRTPVVNGGANAEKTGALN